MMDLIGSRKRVIGIVETPVGFPFNNTRTRRARKTYYNWNICAVCTIQNDISVDVGGGIDN